jgi:hypothetical protein
MMKRGIFDLGAGVLRISRPGASVDTAPLKDLLLHESALFGQIMQFGYVARPGSPYTATVAVANGMGLNVKVITVLDYSSFKAMPAMYVYSSGTAPPNLLTSYTLAADSIAFQFYSTAAAGLYYSLVRRV